MPEDLELEDDELEDDDEVVGSTKTIRDQRAHIKRLEKQVKESASKDAAVLELNFYKAGIPADHALRELFVNGYKGEYTPEAIKAAWEAIPGVQAPTSAATPVETPAPADETPAPTADTGSRERLELASGASPADAKSGNYKEALLQRAETARREGSWKEASAGFVNGIVNGYVQGEIPRLTRDGKRVMVDD